MGVSISGIEIDGISVTREYEHYVLKKDGVEMRCYLGELNECIPEFEEYLKEIQCTKSLQMA